MLRSRLFWQLAGIQVALVLLTALLPTTARGTLASVLLLLVLCASLYITARLAGKVDRLIRIIQQVAAGKSAVVGKSEVSSVADAIVELARENEDLKRQLSEQQRAAQQAREAPVDTQSARSDFLAVLSHEIRTPLNGIMGMTQLALQTAPAADQREYLEIVQSSADFLLAIINDLRDFARLEAEAIRFQSVRFPLRQTLAELMKLLALHAHQKGLELLCRVAPDVPDLLVGDPERLRQLLVNLIANAIQFTDRGEVLLEVSRSDEVPTLGPAAGRADTSMEKLTASSSHSSLPTLRGVMMVHFRISDSGKGIPPEKLASLLERRPSAGDTGIGLAIARQLVEGMRGRIWVESELGHGTALHFTARFAIAADPPAQPTLPAALSGSRVLLVDDHPTSRSILADWLKGWGLAVVECTGVGPALTAVAEPNPEAALTLAVIDSQMPGEDGFALVEKLRHQPQYAAIPVILLIVSDQPGDLARSRRLPNAVAVMKPVNPVELLRALSQLLIVAPAPAPNPAARPTRLRVLVAEGNSANRGLAVVVLEKLGHEVAQATTGLEALQQVAERALDLVLLDLQLPELDGFAVASAIRQREQTAGGRLPIFALIPYGGIEDRDRCREAGMDGYVPKPVQMQDLTRAIESVRPVKS